MLKRKKIIALIFPVFIFLFLIFSTSALAQGLLPEATGESACTRDGGSASDCGDYTVNDIVGMTIIISNWIFGIVGSLTLLMFVYGGFMFLISAGSSDKVSSAKKIITAAVIGLIIVFASYVIIHFVLGSILGVGFTGVLPS
jgi:hypothetical protein